MIDFECKYVVDVPSYMREAYWTGYLLDLFNTPNGKYARLVFVYPDNGVFDVALSLQNDLGYLKNVSLLNLGCSFGISNVCHVKVNARLMCSMGISIDAASGIAIALRIIAKLLAVSDISELCYNIADSCGMSISAGDAITVLSQKYNG